MIDHISLGVVNLKESTEFYKKVFEAIEFALIVEMENTVGFGKKYPEFWLNERVDLQIPTTDNGIHICLRAKSKQQVDCFYSTALQNGATCEGKPGLRPQYSENYYAAFIRDRDGNKVEAVTFV